MTGFGDPGQIIADTLRIGSEAEETARQGVLHLAVQALNTHGLTAATANGVLIGWLQIASLDLERAEIAAGLRRMADMVDATLKHRAA